MLMVCDNITVYGMGEFILLVSLSEFGSLARLPFCFAQAAGRYVLFNTLSLHLLLCMRVS
ncbi:hypothetical protein BT69DRAFT_235780 [Atractiella rhizophila]|nr:hypothetical protein BT69DRAFT_235780 [Atractiella rhizophila]